LNPIPPLAVPNPWALSQKFVENPCRNFEQADLGKISLQTLQFSPRAYRDRRSRTADDNSGLIALRRDAARHQPAFAGFL
jgi:hypothetical protein